MRHLLELLPGAVLPDPQKESDAPGVPLSPPDDEDLLRPAGEEELFVVKHRSLAGRAPGALAKHLLHTFGPVHPALPFPLALRVELDGDRLVTVDPELGFLHQGLEKACEQVPFASLFPVVARVAPLAPLAAEVALARALEELFGVAERVPRRASLWRVAGLELLRVAEHLRVIAQAPLLPAKKRHRAALTDAARTVAGLLDGVTAGGTFARAGGLARALDDDERTRIERGLLAPGDAARGALDAIEEDPELDAHLEGLGTISAYDAIAHALSGPALRACGIADDLRVHDPLYAELAVRPVVQTTGDARARVRVRLEEVGQSLALLARAFALLTDAPPEIVCEVPPVAPPGMASAALEAHNGELLVTVASDSGARPQRVRVRTASAALVAALPVALRGARLDDVVPVLLSLGVTGTEVDR